MLLEQSEVLSHANKLFLEKQFIEAIKIYQTYILDHLKQQIKIDGLGNNQQSIGYYEWFIPEWYTDGIRDGHYKGTAYDFLSLSYLCSKSNDEVMSNGIKWYRNMVDKLPNDYKIIFGLANILSNKGFYEEAIDYYKKVIEIRPNWRRPYECLAYIYEYKRIQKTKSIQMANRLLAIDAHNRSALFVLARNEKNADLKIEKLKRVADLHPRYARATNQIGIVYGGTKKQYDQAIQWYKKCTKIVPLYASCYNNIGVNYQLKKQYTEAMQWYFQGILRDRQYKAAHTNISDVFDTLKFTDEQVQQAMRNHNIVHEDYFYYYLGLAYYDKQKYQTSISYYMKAKVNAKQLGKQIYKLYNSIGITYDEMRAYDDAIQYYKMCIDKNPQYFSAYYNMAIVYKSKNNIPEATNWYKKAIQVNPRYSYAYNNLGNIYKNAGNYQEAVKHYKKAVQFLSTYTLALANMGICYLKLKNYREAFSAMSRAKEILATDNNNLSESNKTFLKETLEQFQKQGQSWRQNGIVTESLKSHIQNYESKFKNLYANQEKQPVLIEKVMKQQALQIVKLVKEDQFKLTNIDHIFGLVRKIYEDNEEYFHILPQIFVQHFYQSAFINKQSISQIQQRIFEAIQRFQSKSFLASKIKSDQIYQQRNIQLSNFKTYKYSDINVINILKKPFFQDYHDLQKDILDVHIATKASYSQFKSFVDQIRKQSNGIPYGVCVKLPSSEKERFRAITQIFGQIFEKQLDRSRVKQIATHIFETLKQKHQISGNINLEQVQNYSSKIWANEITAILRKRREEKTQTIGAIGDLVKGKIMFESIDYIKKALQVADKLCENKNYLILKIQNQLCSATQQVIVNVKIKQAVCQLKLGLKQDQNEQNFIQLVKQIQFSPIGCIFGSCLLMQKELQYSLLRNCTDIVDHLTNNKDESLSKALEGAIYIITCLNESNLFFK